MSLDAGKLRHRVKLQRKVTTRNDFGDVLPTWVEVAKLWASVEPLSGREFIAAQTTQSKISARVTIRYRAGLNHDMRILHRGQVYNIEAILADKDSGIEYLSIMCSEGVNDG